MKEMVGFVSFTNIDLYTGTFHLDINFIVFCTLIFHQNFCNWGFIILNNSRHSHVVIIIMMIYRLFFSDISEHNFSSFKISFFCKIWLKVHINFHNHLINHLMLQLHSSAKNSWFFTLLFYTYDKAVIKESLISLLL